MLDQIKSKPRWAKLSKPESNKNK